MKLLQINFKELIKGICIICLYYLVQLFSIIPLVIFINLKLIKNTSGTINLFIYLILSIVFTLINIKDLIKDFKDLKKNYKSILKTTINYWIKGYFIMIVSSYIFSAIGLIENTNQASNEELLYQTPVIGIITMVFLGPLVEELVFRKGLRKATNNKYLYALASGLIFGLIHVTSSIHGVKDLIMLLYLIPYSSLGVAFGLAYYKTDNIYGSIIVHALHNALAIALILGGI